MASSDPDYDYLRALVRNHSSNVIAPTRNALFDVKLAPLVRTAGADNVSSLVRMLRANQPQHLHRAVAEAMTINETSFFRDVKPFHLLERQVLPWLIEQRRPQRRLRIWSAASSTGQEAYSLAMLLTDRFPETASWDVQIIGTDISQRVVEYARQGRYRKLEVNRGLPAAMLVRYFTRDNEEWLIDSSLRAMCRFQCLNLCAPGSPLPTFDLVLMRNVLLYFSQGDRSIAFRSVHRNLAPDGYLLLGNSEQADESTDLFKVEFSEGANSFFYRPHTL
jgi:chemotaxis protein methyltransferase CheR